jgi:hypothetical protein
LEGFSVELGVTTSFLDGGLCENIVTKNWLLKEIFKSSPKKTSKNAFSHSSQKLKKLKKNRATPKSIFYISYRNKVEFQKSKTKKEQHCSNCSFLKSRHNQKKKNYSLTWICILSFKIISITMNPKKKE